MLLRKTLFSAYLQPIQACTNKSFVCFAGNKSKRFLVLMSPVLPFDSDSVENFYDVLDAVMGLVVLV